MRANTIINKSIVLFENIPFIACEYLCVISTDCVFVKTPMFCLANIHVKYISIPAVIGTMLTALPISPTTRGITYGIFTAKSIGTRIKRTLSLLPNP